MTTVPVSFDAATAPLQPGVNLVEASAGTGKTFAIAMLVLRFVTERNIPLPEILVVTFTKAATEELKDRIRARLASARELLAQQQETEDNREDDPALTAWREGLQQLGIAEELALHRLELALLDMDLAPVFTIHGFCQRMLQEQAMESGQLFDFELTTDTARWRLQVVHDYWRRTLYPLPPLHCALITSRFATPDALFDSIKGAADRTGRREPACSSVAEALEGFDLHRQQLAAWWRDTSHTLYTDLSQAIDQGLFKKELRENFNTWWQQVDAFLAQGHPRLPDTLDFLSAAWIRDNLNGQKFRDSKTESGEEKKQIFLDTLALPEPVISDFLQAWQGVHLALRAGLLAELSDGLARSLRHQGLLSFDELIRQLAQSLAGAQGAQLRRILRARYPVALIDEFQDTDDDQFFIFSTLFAAPVSTENERPTGRLSFLYLIGDPKQAIYTFRGADIYSYFTARRQAARHLNLAHNHRSHPALVAAVNGLFSLRPDAFFTDQLGYHPVQPARKAGDGQLLHGGAALPVMVYGELEPAADPDGRWHSGKATEALIRWVVAEIQRISNPDDPVLLDVQGTTRPLAPRDIAILVRSNRQAEQMQGALANAGIPVVMASRQPVFETAECGDLLLLLQAINLPGDARLLKTALTRPWFNLTGQQLYALWQDAEQLNLWLDRLYGYHQLWQERGFLTMMTALLEQEQLLLHLARMPLAERRITNIHHLLELIQTEAAYEAMGPARTVQWLQTMRDNSQGMENTELRLESDDEAVRIVTMHGAKGLEYPVVFCPFLWYRNNRLASEQGAVTCHDTANRLVTDLGSPDFAQRRSQAVEEELAEELRLAYVALTRARCRCYTCWAEVKGNRFVADSRHSSLAWLLSLETGEQDFSDQVQLLRQRQQPDETAVLVIPAAVDARATGTSRRDEGLAALAPQRLAGRSLHTDWTLLSYSSLSASPAEQPRTFPSPASPADDDTPTPERAGNIELLPELPKGAALGNVIHALLEDTPFTTLAAQSGYEALLRQQCSWFNVAADPAILSALLRKVVQTPLRAGATAFCLCDLPETDTIKEMPFYFRLQPGSTAAINTILVDSPVTTPITPRAIKGYLTGFIDLICRHQGKFYIMDYKSNWLGRRLADYGPSQLTRAMAEHNYGLQYWLYTLVLHRYLRDSLDGYDYDSHFGGVCYLFVRGMEPSQPGSGIFYDLPDFSTLTRLDACLGSADAHTPTHPHTTGGEDAD